MAYKRLNSSLA